MSRIGNKPIEVPAGVTVIIAGQLVTAKGKNGELKATLVNEVAISQNDNILTVNPVGDSRFSRKMWGTTRTVISNLIVGVSAGFVKNLEINGVGYRAQVQGKDLVLQLGYSHEIRHPIPEGVVIKCETQNEISIFGIDKQNVGSIAAKIRSYRPPEPYKGKGVKYKDEIILRKEGKKK